MTTTRFFPRALRLALAGAVVLVAACSDFFKVSDPNSPTQDDLLLNPTKLKLAGAATGIFATARGDIQGFIWRVGSMGREGINLLGNNQPDYIEPFFGPLNGSGFGGSLWLSRYAHIRSINIYLDALPRATDLTAAEVAASRGMANTFKALAFLYVVETRAQLGAPVDVDRPVDAPPAPFVSEDSVYGYILGLLAGARTDLAAAGAKFPFPVPAGLSTFGDPASFVPFTWALTAKAQVLRATEGCGGSPTTCWTAALAALGNSFLVADSTQFGLGAYFDFSTAPGDATNDLSDPVNALNFFALKDFATDAQLQLGGTQPDKRVVDKIVAARDTQTLGGIAIKGENKFTVYWTNGVTNLNHPIPIIRNEELILLRAEANIGLGNKAAAITDLDLVRQGAGNLPPTTLTVASPTAAFVSELIYNRRYSLMWEQGTRWIDARRYGLLATIPPDVTNGSVPSVMPIPNTECSARSEAAGCTP